MKIEGKNRGEEGTTPETTACPEPGKMSVKKENRRAHGRSVVENIHTTPFST